MAAPQPDPITSREPSLNKPNYPSLSSHIMLSTFCEGKGEEHDDATTKHVTQYTFSLLRCDDA